MSQSLLFSKMPSFIISLIAANTNHRDDKKGSIVYKMYASVDLLFDNKQHYLQTTHQHSTILWIHQDGNVVQERWHAISSSKKQRFKHQSSQIMKLRYCGLEHLHQHPPSELFLMMDKKAEILGPAITT